MLPLSVMRLRLELMPALAGWTKQKLPTTSTIQKSLSPVAASMIFSAGGNSIRVVYLTSARIATMSFMWYCTVRADSCARAATDETTKTAFPMNFISRISIRKAKTSKKVHLNVDSVSHWMATNNARDNLKKREYFERFGFADGLLSATMA